MYRLAPYHATSPLNIFTQDLLGFIVGGALDLDWQTCIPCSVPLPFFPDPIAKYDLAPCPFIYWNWIASVIVAEVVALCCMSPCDEPMLVIMCSVCMLWIISIMTCMGHITWLSAVLVMCCHWHKWHIYIETWWRWSFMVLLTQCRSIVGYQYTNLVC